MRTVPVLPLNPAADAGMVEAETVTNVATTAATIFQDIEMLPLRPKWSDRFDGQRVKFSECLREKIGNARMTTS
jgi:hypothetical protein